MPIYEYRCSSCGSQKDYLRKLSDPLLTECPDCGEETLQKMVTAAGFQLKGSGWYATDFKNGSAPQRDKSATAKPDSAKSESAKSEPAKSDATAAATGASAATAPAAESQR